MARDKESDEGPSRGPSAVNSRAISTPVGGGGGSRESERARREAPPRGGAVPRAILSHADSARSDASGLAATGDQGRSTQAKAPQGQRRGFGNGGVPRDVVPLR